MIRNNETTRSKWFQFNLWLHRWTSLIATIPFLILSITGTILIFHDEIDEALGVLPASPGISTEQQPFNVAVENVLISQPNEKVAMIGFEPEEHPGLLLVGTLALGQTGFEHLTRRYASISTGKLTSAVEVSRESFTSVLFELHAQWFLGQPGAILGGVIALLVVVSLLSGMCIYAPYMKKIVFGVLRKRKGQRVYQLDLHNLIGVTVAGWLLVVSMTGFFLGFGSIVTSYWAVNQLKSDVDEKKSLQVDVRRPPIDVDKVFEVALTQAPSDWRVQMVIWPGTDFTTNHNYAALIVGSGIDEKLFKLVLVDAISGDVTDTVSLPWYMKVIVLSQPLHFGDYGGIVLKLLWTTFAWLTMFIVCNGAWLWWKRRGHRVNTIKVLNVKRGQYETK